MCGINKRVSLVAGEFIVMEIRLRLRSVLSVKKKNGCEKCEINDLYILIIADSFIKGHILLRNQKRKIEELPIAS